MGNKELLYFTGIIVAFLVFLIVLGYISNYTAKEEPKQDVVAEELSVSNLLSDVEYIKSLCVPTNMIPMPEGYYNVVNYSPTIKVESYTINFAKQSSTYGRNTPLLFTVQSHLACHELMMWINEIMVAYHNGEVTNATLTISIPGL